MRYNSILLNLLPPISYNRTGEAIRQSIQIEANCLDSIQESAQRLNAVIDPKTSGQHLQQWERLLGLDPSNKNTQQRIQGVLLKINELGGLSIPYFTRLANSIGYQIQITEPQPFRAGINRAGDRLATEDIMWVWWVNISNTNAQISQFTAGISAMGDRLTDYGDLIIENILNDLKPAFTQIRFTYKRG